MADLYPSPITAHGLRRAFGWLGTCLPWLARWSRIIRLHRRVPVLLQQSAVECGAACLAMILRYYGHHIRVAECHERCGVGRDGVTARTLVAAARSYGLRAKVYSIEPADLRYVRLPAIAHWNFNHFVVVERRSSRRVVVVDPTFGRRSLTVREFDEGFTGVVLALEPGVHFERRAAAAGLSWRHFLRLSVAQTPGVLTQILAASLFLQLIGLVLPVITQVLVDRVLPMRINSVMPVLGIGLVLLGLMYMTITYLRAALLIYLEGRLDTQMMLGFLEHLLALPFEYFQQHSSGDLLMRLASNAIIRDALSSQAISIVLDGLFVLGYLAILLVWSPTFGALVLGIGLLQVGLFLGTIRPVRAVTQRNLIAQAESQSYLVELLAGIATVKASGAEDRSLDHWSNLFFAELNTTLCRNHLLALIDTATTLVRTGAPLLLLWFGAVRVLDGATSVGSMLAMNALAIAFLTPLASLGTNVQRLQVAGAHLERIAHVLEAAPEQQPQSGEQVSDISGRIELDAVSFQYDPQAPLVLHDISVSIEPGQKVALVGRTGSGKSTLAMLLLGLYPPTIGDIRYDGRSLQSLNYRALRSQFGVVLQDASIFSGSIRQNIAANDPGVSLEQIMTAARLAAIHDDIVAMPMGYETFVAEGGSALSGGQRQRLAIARALVRTPSVLLLDEATSHLDTVTERLVDESLSQLACTRIVIAHRLSTIRNADLILVLDGGTIIERGTHEALLARGGHYAALIRSQGEH